MVSLKRARLGDHFGTNLSHVTTELWRFEDSSNMQVRIGVGGIEG